MQPREYDGQIPFFMDKAHPEDDMMRSFDLVRVTIMPKNEDGLKKPRKNCFTLKSVGPTVRSLSSVLPHLRESMHKSKEDAEADSLHVVRGDDAKYQNAKGDPLPYAHQIDCMPPKDDRENYKESEITSVSFLEEKLDKGTTFIYDSPDSKVVRMCVNPTGCTPYMVDMPRAAFLKNANAKDIYGACGIYTFAAHCPGALCAFVTYNRFWSNKLWDEDCGYGDATAFRGAPIIDVSKLLAPLARDEFYLSSPPLSGSGNKARVTVDLGFKMSPGGGDDNQDEDENMSVVSATALYPVFAEVAAAPRRIQGTAMSAYSIASDMRLSAHNTIPLDVAHVMTVYLVKSPEGERHNILNLNYNGARDVGCTVVVTGKKHAWSAAMPSAIDEDEEDDTSEAGTSKRMKIAMDSVA